MCYIQISEATEMRGRELKVLLLNDAVSSEDCIASMVSELNMSMKHGQNGTHMKTSPFWLQ